jgi:hypothetical protein
MLAERVDFLKPAIFELLDCVSVTEIEPVLHRMLAYYGEILPNRRAADKRSKGNAHKPEPTARKLRGRTGTAIVACPAAAQSEEDSAVDRKTSVAVEQLMDQLCNLNQLHCPNGCRWALSGNLSVSRGRIRVTMVCDCGENRREIEITEQQQERLVASLQVDQPKRRRPR